jgi:hypothetical protein
MGTMFQSSITLRIGHPDFCIKITILYYSYILTSTNIIIIYMKVGIDEILQSPTINFIFSA